MNSNEVVRPEMSNIVSISLKLKDVLVKSYKKRYVEIKEIPVESIGDEQIYDLGIFNIDQKEEPIYKGLSSESDLARVKSEILEYYKKDVIAEFSDLLEDVKNIVDENTLESLGMIRKTLVHRQKKMDSAFKKFKTDDLADVSSIKKEFAQVLEKATRDLMEATLISISNGVNTCQFDVYDDVIKILNGYFEYLGIYTKEYKVGDNSDDENVLISATELTTDATKKDKIKSINSLAYLFEDDRCVLEANVTAWRIS